MMILIILFFTFALASDTEINSNNNNNNNTNNSNNTIEEKPSNATKRLYKLSDYEDSLYIQDLLRAAKAAEMQAHLKENINPCSNFYEFACGNFRKFHPSSSRILQIIEEDYATRAESLLNSSSNTLIDTKLKLFYNSCLNVTQIAGSYKTKLLSIVSEFGKMPVLSPNANWNASEFDWIAMIAKMHRNYGKKALIALNVAADFHDNRIQCLYIGQPNLLLPMKSMYSNDGYDGKLYKSAAKAVIAEKLQQFLNVPQKLAEQSAAEIIEFEVLLAKGMWDGRPDIDKMNTPTSTFYLNKKYAPIIDIKRLMTLTLGITRTNCMYEHVASYLENLKTFITQIPKHVIANYLFFMLLNDEFFLQTKENEKAQRRLCVQKLRKYFPKLFDNFLYRHSKTDNLENDFNMIFNSLKETLLRNFTADKCDWLKPKARYSAIEKLDELRLVFNAHTAEDFRSEYKELNLTNNDYIENMKRLQLLKGKEFKGLIAKTPKRIDDDDDVALVSTTPVYFVQQNLIRVPVSLLLQNILWPSCFPMALKYAQIGALIGHALVHGFDDEGRKYDKYGNQHNWWDLDTMQAFNEQKNCLLEQSKQLPFGSNYLHDEFLLAEIIADNGGIKLAYDAYMHWYNDSSRMPLDLRRECFSTMKFTHQQVFFISYAQFWCSDVSEALVNLSVTSDAHSPNLFRVIGSLKNVPEFATAFKCRNGTNMNPVKKCRVF